MENQAAALITKYSNIATVLLPRVTAWLLNLAGALLILAVGWLGARLIGGIVKRVLDRQPRIDSTIKPFLVSLVRYAILVLVVLAAVAQVGVQTASILAVVGAAGLAIGLALQGTLSNVAAGVMLLALRPLRVDEYIDADGIAGTVREVGLFNTTLYSIDGLCLFVPNAKLWGATIKNYSRLGRRRFDIQVGVGYDADVDTARAELMSLMSADPRVLKEPRPDVFVADLGDSAVLLTMRGWVASSDYLAVINDTKRAIKYALDAAGITIPFPQHVVHVTAHEAAAAGTKASA
jgi:small conductance mechanosensitive channel